MFPVVIGAARSVALATVRSTPRFLIPSSRIGAASITPAASKGLLSRLVGWMRGKIGTISLGGVIKDIVLSAAVYSLFDIIFDANDEESMNASDSAVIRTLFLTKPVLLALEGTAGAGDPESAAIILDNLAMAILADAGDGDIKTIQGASTAIAADYIRKTVGGVRIFSNGDAIFQISRFIEEDFLGGQVSLTTDDLKQFEELMSTEYSGTTVERMIDLFAYQCSQLSMYKELA